MQKVQAEPAEGRRPFCIYLSHRPGHPPYKTPEGIAGMYAEADVSRVLPPHADPLWYGKTKGNVFQGVMMGSYENKYRKYCETLTAMDQDIVRLLEEMDGMGLAKNTVVIYMGDNGMQWGTHDCHGIREAYEDSLRLPLIVRAPGLVPDPGSKRRQMVLNIDMAPTLLNLAGLDAPAAMNGQSLVPFLISPEAHGRESFLIEFWRYFPENTPSYTGIRTDRFKYIEFARGRSPWLFDLLNDPLEMHNLMGTPQGEKILPQLKGRLAQLIARSGLD
jgi:N-acetylglucosamine-6-sulfatase